MTYTVSSGTLNQTLLNSQLLQGFISDALDKCLKSLSVTHNMRLWQQLLGC